MSDAFAPFTQQVHHLAPRTALVVGSGLSGGTSEFREIASIRFGDIPGLVSPTISGHTGRLAVGMWCEAPVLIFFGRLHYYEGHSWGTVTAPVRVAANLGVQTLILTNASGGIHPSLCPGALMAIRSHLPMLDTRGWKGLMPGRARVSPYSPRLIEQIQTHEKLAGQDLLVGTYAALTGPSYETPAEIRAFRACGADAVGMSTAFEADAAAALGLEVGAISCVTNRAAGLGDGPLAHADVLDAARLAATRLGRLLGDLIGAATPGDARG
jgi:purine-nucleoside phosphorylase